nr:hypothetical protein [Trinickia acidisoli]
MRLMISCAIKVQDAGASAMHKQLAQIGIATLADSEQALLAARGELFRHETEPGDQTETVFLCRRKR